jgi:hypothetical protein
MEILDWRFMFSAIQPDNIYIGLGCFTARNNLEEIENLDNSSRRSGITVHRKLGEVPQRKRRASSASNVGSRL